MNGDLEDVVVNLGTRLRKFRDAFAAELLERTRRRTPVATGALQNGWGYTRKQEGFEVWNIKDYAAFVEYGTHRQAPVGMLRASLAESEQIAQVAAERVGLKQ